MSETIQSLKDELASHPLVQSSAYFYIASQIKNGTLKKRDLQKLLTWINSAEISVSVSDVAGWIGM